MCAPKHPFISPPYFFEELESLYFAIFCRFCQQHMACKSGTVQQRQRPSVHNKKLWPSPESTPPPSLTTHLLTITLLPPHLSSSPSFRLQLPFPKLNHRAFYSDFSIWMQTQLMSSSVAGKSVFGFLSLISGDGVFYTPYTPSNSLFSTEIVGEGQLGRVPWRKKRREKEEEAPLGSGEVYRRPSALRDVLS